MRRFLSRAEGRSVEVPSSRSMVFVLVLSFAIAPLKGRKSFAIVWSILNGNAAGVLFADALEPFLWGPYARARARLEGLRAQLNEVKEEFGHFKRAFNGRKVKA